MSAFFSIARSFFIFSSFHARRLLTEADFESKQSRVNIEMWSDDCFMLIRVMQCMSLLVIFSDIKMRLIVLCDSRISHVMKSLNSVNESFALSIMSIKAFAIACCVKRVKSLQYEWCRLKSLSTIYFSEISNCWAKFDKVENSLREL